jgi:uncharacterized protein (DUF1684 family)
MKFGLIAFAAFFSVCVQAQSYKDSMQTYQANYVNTHGVLKGHDATHISFYPVSETYRITAGFERKENMPWFNMATSGTAIPLYRIYGTLHFSLNGQHLHLNLYQSQNLMDKEEYKTHLFLPFTDATNGKGTYEGGRYIDLSYEDIKEGKIAIDFNKAYNPYCAYVSGKYNCPIPPSENALQVKIEAGEKQFSNSH